jgi:hypothetical protein
MSIFTICVAVLFLVLEIASYCHMDFEKFFQNSYGSESDGEQDFDPN